MKSIIGMYSWLNIATSGIRFGPDRAAARRELAEHIEDRTADLMRIFPDISEEEAGERALAAMGDAWELKKELARRPDMKLQDAVDITGFGNQATLIRVFKKIEGITPGQYRDNIQEAAVRE